MVRILFFFSILFLCFSCKDAVEEQQDTDSLYVSEVFRYVYAPGQHAATVSPSDSTAFIGNPAQNKRTVYLGGFGGYIIAGFDHNIINKAGEDFEVILMKSMAPEPAVVYVMPDLNGDEKPNETWYELKGSQFSNSKRNYWVRYYRATSTADNITWLDSEGCRGELKSGYSTASTASWWWSETKTDSITFYGTRLPDSYENTGTASAQFWIVPTGKFTWGYAENNLGTDYDADTGSNKLDISNAVDESGNAVSLPNIRFIKIQTAVFQQAGWLNEVSSEIRGAKEIN